MRIDSIRQANVCKLWALDDEPYRPRWGINGPATSDVDLLTQILFTDFVELHVITYLAVLDRARNAAAPDG